MPPLTFNQARIIAEQKGLKLEEIPQPSYRLYFESDPKVRYPKAYQFESLEEVLDHLDQVAKLEVPLTIEQMQKFAAEAGLELTQVQENTVLYRLGYPVAQAPDNFQEIMITGSETEHWFNNVLDEFFDELGLPPKWSDTPKGGPDPS
jgi:hypothetical protein